MRNRMVTTGVAAGLLLSTAACSSNRPMATVSPPMLARLMPSQEGGRPDFSLTLNPTNATITSGQSVGVTVTLQSIHGLAGTIRVEVSSVLPPLSARSKPTIEQRTYDIPLRANGTGGTLIEFGATEATFKTTYVITITGTDIGGGCCHGLSHSENFTVT